MLFPVYAFIVFMCNIMTIVSCMVCRHVYTPRECLENASTSSLQRDSAVIHLKVMYGMDDWRFMLFPWFALIVFPCNIMTIVSCMVCRHVNTPRACLENACTSSLQVDSAIDISDYFHVEGKVRSGQMTSYYSPCMSGSSSCRLLRRLLGIQKLSYSLVKPWKNRCFTPRTQSQHMI